MPLMQDIQMETVSELSKAGILTSEQLVKTLRTPQPKYNKVRIAAEAWRQNDLFVPKKADLLSKWTLEHLCSSLRGSSASKLTSTKTRDASFSDGLAPEFSLEAWQLLHNVVESQVGTTRVSQISEAAKGSWLASLAATQPTLQLASAIANYLSQSKSTPDGLTLLETSANTLKQLLPPSSSRVAATNIEAVTDTIQAWLDFLSTSRSTRERDCALVILQSIVPSWSTALQYGSNAKRNHQHFTANSLQSFVLALRQLQILKDPVSSSFRLNATLVDLVVQVGAQSLFTNEALRIVLQARQNSSVTQYASGSSKKSLPNGVIAKLADLLDPQGDPSMIVATLHILPTLCSLMQDKLIGSEALSSTAATSSSSAGARDPQQNLVRKSMLYEFLFPILACMTRLAQHSPDQALQLAQARKGLLQCIDDHGLYVAGSPEHEQWTSLLDALFQRIHQDLQSAIMATDREVTARQIQYNFESLSSLWRLEKGVVENHLMSILALAAMQPVVKKHLWLPEQLEPSTMAALGFFRSVADIHTKFRTVPSLLSLLLRSMVDAADLVKMAHSVPLQRCLFGSQTFLSELGKLCRDSIMPVQVADTVRQVVGDSQVVGTVEEMIRSSSPQKRRRQTRSSSPTKSTSNRNVPSAAFSTPNEVSALISQLHIVAQVLQSVSVVPTLRADCLQAAQTVHNKLILPALDLGLKQDRARSQDSVVFQVSAAALRARQSLLMEKWRYDSSEPAKLDGSLPVESLSFLESDFDERADLLLETFRTQTASSGAGEEESSLHQLHLMTIQSIFQRAERDSLYGRAATSLYCQQVQGPTGLVSNVSKALIAMVRDPQPSRAGQQDYAGNLFDLQSHEALLQAVWTMFATRWAALLDQLASPETLNDLAQVIVLTTSTSVAKPIRSPLQFVSTAALKDASFLELTRWRAQFLDCVQKELEDTSPHDLDGRLTATSALSTVSLDWILKAHRSSLFTSLLVLDRDVLTQYASKGRKEQSSEATQGKLTQWTALRSLIGRFLSDHNLSITLSLEEFDKTLLSFLEPVHSTKADLESMVLASTSLTTFQAGISLLHSRSVKSSEARTALASILSYLESHARSKDGSSVVDLEMKALQSACQTLDEDDLLKMLNPKDASSHLTLIRNSLDRIQYEIEQAQADTKNPNQVLDLCIYHLRDLRHGVSMASISSEAVPTGTGVELMALLSPLCSIIATLSENEQAAPILADLITEYMRAIDVCGRSSDTKNDESRRTNQIGASHVCLAYAALNAAIPVDLVLDTKRISSTLTHIIERVSAEEYNAVLEQLLRLLGSTLSWSNISSDGVGEADKAALVATTGLVLCNGPRNTSKIAKTHLSCLLGLLLMNAARISSDVSVWLSIIHTMETVCSSKAMLLRSQDVTMQLQLFEAVLAPSMVDEPLVLTSSASAASKTKTALFLGVVACLGSIIRLRQDLVLTSLPQLAALLSRMCTLFRRVRTASVQQGSGLHNRQLRRDLPAWLDPLRVQPLQASPEARAFSRLLVGLTVKNVALQSGIGATKAESLARPFSKHATHVLVSYLRTLTSANTTVPVDVRSELEPGMMALCGMIGYHQRDSAMVAMLDSAGKTLLKRLWKTYEAQRYKGE